MIPKNMKWTKWSPYKPCNVLSLSSLLNCHKGETAWVFGKGPSFDSYDDSKVGSLRLCINHTVLFVRNPMYFFAGDSGIVKEISVPLGCKAVLEPAKAVLARLKGCRDIVVFNKGQDERRLLFYSAEEIASFGKLFGKYGTVHMCLHFCKLIGASFVELIGIDGGSGYTKKVKGYNQDYTLSRDYCVEMLELLGLQYHFAEVL